MVSVWSGKRGRSAGADEAKKKGEAIDREEEGVGVAARRHGSGRYPPPVGRGTEVERWWGSKRAYTAVDKREPHEKEKGEEESACGMGERRVDEEEEVGRGGGGEKKEGEVVWTARGGKESGVEGCHPVEVPSSSTSRSEEAASESGGAAAVVVGEKWVGALRLRR